MGLFDFLDRWAEQAKKDAGKRQQEAEKRRKEKEEEVYRQRLVAGYEFDRPGLLRVISDSVEIIKNTKNLKTALGRFATLRHNYGRLLVRNPDRTPIDISIGKWASAQNVATHAEVVKIIDSAKTDYHRAYITDKVHGELLKADSLTDKKLITAQLKKALKVALDGVVQLPKDSEIKRLVANIEARIAQV